MTIRTVAETGSTNADMLELARAGAAEGLWLRAERQVAGRGRQGRAWASPVGNFYGSTLVRLRPTDPRAATLAFVAGVAVEEAVTAFLSSPSRRFGAPQKVILSGDPFAPPSLSRREREGPRSAQPGGKGEDSLALKWPNDLLIGNAKIAGILLERADDAVVVGVGVNLAHHPDLSDRPTASLAAAGFAVAPDIFAEALADTMARWLARWRGEGLAPVRARWLERAHPAGTALTARLPDGTVVDGLFDGLTAEGALTLRLASGERRVIHAGDVFLL